MSSSITEPSRGHHVPKGIFMVGKLASEDDCEPTSSGLYGAGLQGDCSVPKPMERPLNSREPRRAPRYPEQTPRGSGSLLRQVWAIMDFRPVLCLLHPSLAWRSSPWLDATPSCSDQQAAQSPSLQNPLTPPAHSSPCKWLVLTHYPSSQNERKSPLC